MIEFLKKFQNFFGLKITGIHFVMRKVARLYSIFEMYVLYERQTGLGNAYCDEPASLWCARLLSKQIRCKLSLKWPETISSIQSTRKQLAEKVAELASIEVLSAIRHAVQTTRNSRLFGRRIRSMFRLSHRIIQCNDTG